MLSIIYQPLTYFQVLQLGGTVIVCLLALAGLIIQRKKHEASTNEELDNNYGTIELLTTDKTCAEIELEQEKENNERILKIKDDTITAMLTASKNELLKKDEEHITIMQGIQSILNKKDEEILKLTPKKLTPEQKVTLGLRQRLEKAPYKYEAVQDSRQPQPQQFSELKELISKDFQEYGLDKATQSVSGNIARAVRLGLIEMKERIDSKEQHRHDLRESVNRLERFERNVELSLKDLHKLIERYPNVDIRRCGIDDRFVSEIEQAIIDASQAVADGKNKVIANRDDQIKNHKDTIFQRDMKISSLEKELEEKDKVEDGYWKVVPIRDKLCAPFIVQVVDGDVYKMGDIHHSKQENYKFLEFLMKDNSQENIPF